MKKNLLDKYSSEIEDLKNYIEVDSIIVFGSYASGNVKPLSDLDICIITGKDTLKKKEREILSFGTEELDISLFHKLPLSLQYKILTEGKVIYNKLDLDYLRIKITNKWFDFKPVLRRLYKERNYPFEI